MKRRWIWIAAVFAVVGTAVVIALARHQSARERDEHRGARDVRAFIGALHDRDYAAACELVAPRSPVLKRGRAGCPALMKHATGRYPWPASGRIDVDTEYWSSREMRVDASYASQGIDVIMGGTGGSIALLYLVRDGDTMRILHVSGHF
jgi:hypothetical protein